MWLKTDNGFKEITAIYKKSQSGWTELSDWDSIISNYQHFLYGGELANSIQSITILSASDIKGESSQLHLLYNKTQVSSGINWSVITGSEYASISQEGLLTISENANGSNVVISAEYNGLIAEKTIMVTYKSGVSQETQTTVNDDGTSTETTITTNNDGSSVSKSVTTDENGNVINESDKTVNKDGSSIEIVTVYDEDGNIAQTSSTNIDTSGNSSTQTKDIDEDGNEVVTSYIIDTSNNESGGMNVNENINTGFIPFTNGKDWELDFRFIYDYKDNIGTSVPISGSYFKNGVLQSGFSMRMTQPGS